MTTGKMNTGILEDMVRQNFPISHLCFNPGTPSRGPE